MERKQALKLGVKHYVTGRPCKHGHVAKRYTHSGACFVCNDLKAKKWQKQNREKVLKWNRRWRGTPEATSPMPDICECCGAARTAGKEFHRDHDHETGKFRGWLCHKCNLGIGSLGDTLHGVKNAIKYLSADRS